MSAETNSPSAANSPRKLWKTALLLAGSGILGGIAVALWNRRELADIQSQRNGPTSDKPHVSTEEEIY